ncbi:hypothetical protein QN277_010050 [Acacia crassicarpa]|uniref:Uncharacterized protein n=1 Tax=Acacia crassicarpa TaxID=499986 RepID=A0AAE1M9R9_9FABA|nr:hypothetical protein QN277_010050 [Acacia crassicarpa]
MEISVSVMIRDPSDVEAEQKQLEQAIKNSRERDRRTLLHGWWKMLKLFFFTCLSYVLPLFVPKGAILL